MNDKSPHLWPKWFDREKGFGEIFASPVKHGLRIEPAKP